MKQFFLLLLATLPLLAEPGDHIYQKGYLSTEDAHKSIELQDGYRLELVLSDPDIQEPVSMAWDGNGVLYVVEMRTYMQDADATGEQAPRSRISRHEDTTGDGVYDKHSVFIDNILLPRMVLPLDDRVMVGITNSLDLWNYRDSNGDGVADEKVKIYKGGRRGGNMEHQPSGLIWNLDNWIYLTYESKRYRFTNGKLEVQKLPRGGGQWGLGRDDAGRLYYSAAGGERPAFYFQQPIAYGAMNLENQLSPQFKAVYPIADVPDVQGGRKRVNNRGGLNYFTGCAGQDVYRGDRLPADLKGDLLIPEPVGRLIRRAKVTRKDGKTVLSNAYPGSEFIRSRDINFRPLWSTTSPDGGMMIIDMHRGIIQQGNWTRPESYLRGVIEKWGLDKNINKGRIYRLVHDSYKPDKKPQMLKESTKELVAHLTHPNGWWRDTAQKLILLRKDRESVIPELKKIVSSHSSELGRLHALWTLEGMNQATPNLIKKALSDSSSLVRCSAIRIAEPFLKQDNNEVIEALVRAPHLSSDIEMALQFLNSSEASGSKNKTLAKTSAELFKKHADNEAIKGIQAIRQAIIDAQKTRDAQKLKGRHFAESMQRGKLIYQQLCFSCHGADGLGAPMPGKPGHKLAPSFVNNPRLQGSHDHSIRILLHGLTGKLDGREYEGLMVPMASNDDKWLADITTYIRNSFSNKSDLTYPKDIAAIRKKHSDRKTPWTQSELEKISPPILGNHHEWKLSSSHGSKSLKGCIDHDSSTRFTTGTFQKPDMWLQIEFPREVEINQLNLDSRRSRTDHPAQYELTVSSDGKAWGKPIAQGKGTSSATKINIPPTKTRFIRLTQKGKKRFYWSIFELQILGKEAAQ